MLTVSIITAPREPCYLSESLDSFRRQWDYTPHVFAEPGSINPRPQHVHWHQNNKRLGIVGNWLRALRHKCDTPYYMICEDDIEWLPGTADKIREVLITGIVRNYNTRDIGFISPYCSKVNGREACIPFDTWQEPRFPKTWGWCGALCIIMPQATVDLIIQNKDEFIRLAENDRGKGPKYLDFAIGEICRNNNRPIITHMPTLIMHLGQISTDEANNGVQNEARKPCTYKE